MGMTLYTTAQGPESENPPVQLLQQETYRCCLCQIRGGFRLDRMVHTGRYSGKIRYDTRRHPFAGVSEQYPIQEGTWADILLKAPLRPLEEFRTGEQSGILYRQGGYGKIQTLPRLCLRNSAIPSDQSREERTVRPIPKSRV